MGSSRRVFKQVQDFRSLEIAERLGLRQDDAVLRDLTEEANRLCKMIYSLIAKLKTGKWPATKAQRSHANNRQAMTNNH